MKSLAQAFKMTILILILTLIGFILVKYYSVIFSVSVKGEITAVEKIEVPVAVVAGAEARADIPTKVFSFAVGIKDQKTGIIHTASSEDRQWAVAQKGQCAEAEFLPYPPWNFEKKGTYFGARLIQLQDCPK